MVKIGSKRSKPYNTKSLGKPEKNDKRKVVLSQARK